MTILFIAEACLLARKIKRVLEHHGRSRTGRISEDESRAVR
jgi:hypothetical protein